MDKNDCCKHSIRNREAIKKSKQCGCYQCMTVFNSEEIKKWCDRSQTALCPHCGIDSLLPDVTDVKFLTECNIRWFTEMYDINGEKVCR